MKWLIIGFIIGFLVAFSFNYLDLSKGVVERRMVTKITDGDTIVVSGGFNVRLLGIDTDERGHRCYKEAKERLGKLVLGREVDLESGPEDKGQYGRLLRYVILDGENINVKMVSEGLAVARFFPGNEKYREEIVSAETNAIENKIGCKWQG
jgi:micrococcal nuclease